MNYRINQEKPSSDFLPLTCCQPGESGDSSLFLCLCFIPNSRNTMRDFTEMLWSWMNCWGKHSRKNLNEKLKVQSLSCGQLFVNPWTPACQASLSVTNSWSLLKLMSIVLVMSSNHLILCHPLLLPPSIFPSMRVFSMSQFFASGGQNIGVSASASVLLMNIQDWFQQSHSWAYIQKRWKH